jgi:hypothetical protein
MDGASKKVAQAILSKKGMAGADSESEPDEKSEGRKAAASDVMRALESGDVDAFDAALSDFVTMC